MRWIALGFLVTCLTLVGCSDGAKNTDPKMPSGSTPDPRIKAPSSRSTPGTGSAPKPSAAPKVN